MILLAYIIYYKTWGDKFPIHKKNSTKKVIFLSNAFYGGKRTGLWYYQSIYHIVSWKSKIFGVYLFMLRICEASVEKFTKLLFFLYMLSFYYTTRLFNIWMRSVKNLYNFKMYLVRTWTFLCYNLKSFFLKAVIYFHISIR